VKSCVGGYAYCQATASHFTDKNLHRVSLVKLMGKRLLSRPNSRWKGNNNLKNVDWEGVN